MTEGLKWTVNQVPKSSDSYLNLMSKENVQKANDFHKSFPQYSVTPLQKLSALTGIEIPESEYVEAPAMDIPYTAQIVDANKQVVE